MRPSNYNGPERSVVGRQHEACTSKDMTPSSREKILVVQTSFVGDTVLTIPLLSELKRHFSGGELAVLCTPQAKSLLEDNPDIDELIPYEKKKKGKKWLGLWRQARQLRSRGFTMAISPHKSFTSGLLLFLARIPYRIGFRQSAGWFLYHKRVNRDSTRHDVERNLSLLEALGIDPPYAAPCVRMEIGGRVHEAVKHLFLSLGVKEDRLTFGINPGSVWPTKRWTAEGYAELVSYLRKKYQCQILLFGGPEDHTVLDTIQRLSGNVGINLAGKITLGDLPAALDWCDVFITNDSGPMHVAVARDVPVVALFCATTPSLGFYPYSAKAVVVEKDLPCRPCGSHGGLRCPLGTEACMRLIRAEDVLLAVERLLNGAGREHSAEQGLYLPQRMVL
jgi:heptosyltransferase-2